MNEDNDENLCAYYDEDDCRFAYVYYYKDDKVEIRAQKERECPPKVRKCIFLYLLLFVKKILKFYFDRVIDQKKH